jgi:hypothetical protein
MVVLLYHRHKLLDLIFKIYLKCFILHLKVRSLSQLNKTVFKTRIVLCCICRFGDLNVRTVRLPDTPECFFYVSDSVKCVAFLEISRITHYVVDSSN